VNNRETSQLGITYRGGPLAPETEPGTTTLRSGDRAPDSICSDPDRGTDIRLFDLFRGPQRTVLAFADTDRPTGNAPTQLHGSEVCTWVIDDRAQGALRDKGNITRAAYGVSGLTTFLIRPDGYVGADRARVAIAQGEPDEAERDAHDALAGAADDGKIN
jgi:hypothetical protein